MNKKELTSRDSLEIASLHQRAFPNFFLTSLGLSFLKVFYDSVLSHPNGIGVGVFEGQKLIGFAVGTTKKDGFYTDVLRRNSINLLATCLIVLIKSPKKIIRLLNAFKKGSDLEENFQGDASLLSICVDPTWGGKGVGREILRYFEEKTFANAENISLTTDAEANDGVNEFYKSANYQFIKSFTQGNRIMNFYIKHKYGI